MAHLDKNLWADETFMLRGDLVDGVDIRAMHAPEKKSSAENRIPVGPLFEL